jgi:rhodanese-related sulfurtransferase
MPPKKTSNNFMYSSSIPEIDVEQLAQLITDRNDSLQLIDVREYHEVEIAAIEGFTVLPLSEFTQWSEVICDRLDPAAETIVICHHGMRSAQMCQWLITKGFSNVVNVMGGIDAYARSIDPKIPRY